MVERYHLRGYDQVKDALERNRKENWLFQGDVWSGRKSGEFMQAEVTVEDGGVFTKPYSGTLTYAPKPDPVAEAVCAENPNEYYNNGCRICQPPRHRISERDRTRRAIRALRYAS